MAFAVLILPEFPVWALRFLHPDLRRREVAVAAAGRVVARSEGLARQGVEAGWPVERVKALAPEAVIRSLAGAEGRLAWEDTLDLLNRTTPWIEPLRPGRATLRFGSPAEASEAAFRLHGRIGVAADRSTALLAAAGAEDGRAAMVPPGREEEFRASLPVAILGQVGVGEATLERLQWLGFPHVGRLARLTREQLCAQFEEGALLDVLARCEDRRPVPLYSPPPVVTGALAFEPPVREPAEYEPALRQALEEAAGRLQGRRATFLTVRMEGGGHSWSSRRVLPSAMAEASKLWNPARLTLVKAHPGGPVEIERLEVVLGGLLAPRRVQGRLWAARPGIEAAVQAVEARFPGRLMKIARVDPWAALPEEAATLEPVNKPPSPRKRP